ncbi:MAG: T9SS type A sorting domain-containing protein, partial [Bacteroidota bacterium]
SLGANSVLEPWEGAGHVPWASGVDNGDAYLDTSLAHLVSHGYALTCDVPAPDYVYFYSPVTGRNERLPAAEMRVYPNPAVHEATLVIPELNGRYAVDILDATGRLMRREELQFTGGEARITRQDLPVGLYHVIVRADGQAHVAKLVFDNRY